MSFTPFTKLTPWSRVLLDKLTISQIVNKFPAFYGTRGFNTAFTNARNLSLFCGRSIKIISSFQYLKMQFNIILPHTSRSSKWSLSLRSSHQIPICSSPLPISATCPTHLILLELITRIIFYEQYTSPSSIICSCFHFPFTSPHLDPNILLSTLFFQNLSLLSSVNVSDQVSRPYKTTGKILFPCILIFIFLGNKLEDKIFCTEW